MRIAHIGLASFFTEGMTYQDNQLSAQNVKDGHEVLYISNAAKYDDNGLIVETGNESLVTETGVQLIRMEYVNIGNKLISNKIRKVRGLYEILCRFAPDVILSHGLMYWSVLDVIKYKKENPKVKLYADTHADVNNSGKNWISRNILHRCFYRYLNQKAAPYLESYLCVSPDSRAFAIDNYGIPEKLTEIYPLGGNILSKEDYIDILCECIRVTPSTVVIHRLTGDPDKSSLVAPIWSQNKVKLLSDINNAFYDRNIVQGEKST